VSDNECLNENSLHEYSPENLKIIFHSNPKLRHLTVNFFNWETMSPEQRQAIFEGYTSLKSLSLHWSDFELTKPKIIDSFLTYRPQVENFELLCITQDSRVGKCNISILAKLLQGLRRVKISEWILFLEQADFAILGQALASCEHLTLKNVDFDNSKPDKVIAFFQPLSHLKNLHFSSSQRQIIQRLSKDLAWLKFWLSMYRVTEFFLQVKKGKKVWFSL